MDKIKRIVLLHVPVSVCNFRCPYCYILQFEGRRAEQLPRFEYSPAQVAKALSKERLGGSCYINICGDGETLLPQEIPLYVAALLNEGHYVDVITNCTLEQRIDELLKISPELIGRLMVKASFHWLEMKRTNMLGAYVRNINKLKTAGVAYTIEITPYDALVPHISDIIRFCEKTFDSLPQITIAWNDANDTTLLSAMSMEEFHKTWSVFNSPMTGFKLSLMGVKRREFCYAGDWSFYTNIATGYATQCYCSCRSLGNIFRNPEKPIKWKAIGNNCLSPHCRNGHMLQTLGAIPGLTDMRYELIRNRICSDGTEWLSPSVKAFLKSQLKDNNNQYSMIKQGLVNLLNRINPESAARRLLPQSLKVIIKKVLSAPPPPSRTKNRCLSDSSCCRNTNYSAALQSERRAA